MSIKNWPGGRISPTPPTPTGPLQNGSASGVWTLDQVAYWLQQGLWPIAGRIARGLFGGGGSSAQANAISYIDITTTGNATAFGDLTVGRFYPASCSSSTRGLWAGGQSYSVGNENIIDYVTIATTGNAIDFGDLTVARQQVSGLSSSTRGVFAGGQDYNTIDYVTIASTGNATDFGDMPIDYQWDGTGTCSSPTRGIIAGGTARNFSGTINSVVNIINYITIATTGDATDFGDLTIVMDLLGGCSSSTRGVFAGTAGSNVISYVTIATLGNAIDFGDLTAAASYGVAACSSQTRGVFAGGAFSSTNVIQYVTIATTGNATYFGDLPVAKGQMAGCSSDHGGL